MPYWLSARYLIGSTVENVPRTLVAVQSSDDLAGEAAATTQDPNSQKATRQTGSDDDMGREGERWASGDC